MKELQEFLQKITSIPEQANVDMVFGEPQELGDRTLIPVAEVSYGYGAGFGTAPEPGKMRACCEEDKADPESTPKMAETAGGGGGGGGSKARPIAYIEIDAEGTRIVPILDEKKIALAGILMVAWIFGWIGLVLKTLLKK